MALGDYTKTTWVNGAAPGISAERLNNNEDKTKELDTELNNHDGAGGTTHPDATPFLAGFMSAEDKSKLDDLNLTNGVWSDTTTSINALTNYTKTIPLGFSATRGKLIAKGLGAGITYGAIAFFNTDITKTIAFQYLSYPTDTSGSTTTTREFNSGNDLIVNTREGSGVDGYQFGSTIFILSVDINESNLEITFRNISDTAQTIAVELLWEVEQ